jgi:hypothetical protein
VGDLRTTGILPNFIIATALAATFVAGRVKRIGE